jgi:hypothetical protein
VQPVERDGVGVRAAENETVGRQPARRGLVRPEPVRFTNFETWFRVSYRIAALITMNELT